MTTCLSKVSISCLRPTIQFNDAWTVWPFDKILSKVESPNRVCTAPRSNKSHTAVYSISVRSWVPLRISCFSLYLWATEHSLSVLPRKQVLPLPDNTVRSVYYVHIHFVSLWSYVEVLLGLSFLKLLFVCSWSTFYFVPKHISLWLHPLRLYNRFFFRWSLRGRKIVDFVDYWLIEYAFRTCNINLGYIKNNLAFLLLISSYYITISTMFAWRNIYFIMSASTAFID